jgi:hypothetical protein
MSRKKERPGGVSARTFWWGGALEVEATRELTDSRIVLLHERH